MFAIKDVLDVVADCRRMQEILPRLSPGREYASVFSKDAVLAPDALPPGDCRSANGRCAGLGCAYRFKIEAVDPKGGVLTKTLARSQNTADAVVWAGVSSYQDRGKRGWASTSPEAM